MSSILSTPYPPGFTMATRRGFAVSCFVAAPRFAALVLPLAAVDGGDRDRTVPRRAIAKKAQEGDKKGDPARPFPP